MIFVKPKEGLKIKRPDTQRLLAPQGEDVPKSSFWLRRLADGDVTIVAKQQQAAPKKVADKQEKSGGVK